MINKALVASVVVAVILTVVCCGAPSNKIKLPIDIQNASNIGSLQIEISYDASVLQATEVEADKLGKDAMIESNLNNPGIIIIGIVDSSGINGSGSIVSISFDVLEKDAASSLTIKNAAAHDVNTLVDLPTSLTQGSFAAGDVSPPSISFK